MARLETLFASSPTAVRTPSQVTRLVGIGGATPAQGPTTLPTPHRSIHQPLPGAPFTTDSWPRSIFPRPIFSTTTAVSNQQTFYSMGKFPLKHNSLPTNENNPPS